MRNKKKKLIATAALLAAASLAWLLFSPYGWLRLEKRREERRGLAARAQKLARENRRLKKKADCLEGGKPCFEEVARRDYGLVRKNEMVLEFKDSGKKR